MSEFERPNKRKANAPRKARNAASVEEDVINKNKYQVKRYESTHQSESEKVLHKRLVKRLVWVKCIDSN